MASRAFEPPPGRSVTAGIIIVGDEILKVCLGQKRGRVRHSPALQSLLHIVLRGGSQGGSPVAAGGCSSESNLLEGK